MMTTPQLAFLINRLTRFGIPDWQVAPTIPALTEGDVVSWSGQRVTGYPDPTVTATVFVNGVSQGSTYTTQTGDAGKSIYVHLSATNMYGTDTIDSAAVVVAGVAAPDTVQSLGMLGGQLSYQEYAREIPFLDIMDRGRSYTSGTSNYGFGLLRVSSMTRTSNVVTVTLQSAPGANPGEFTLVTGQKTAITCMCDRSYDSDGDSITVISQTQFTYPNVGPDGDALVQQTYDVAGCILGSVAVDATTGWPKADHSVYISAGRENPDFLGVYTGTFIGAPAGNVSVLAGSGSISGYSPGASSFTLTVVAGNTDNCQLTFTGVPTDGSYQGLRLIPQGADQSGATILRPQMKTHLQRIGPNGIIRYMDAFFTNGNPSQKSWATRGRRQTGCVIPLEKIIAMQNEIGGHPWLNIPLTAHDDYVTGMANVAIANLAVGKSVIFELSNELWNSHFGFDQYAWCHGYAKAAVKGIFHGGDPYLGYTEFSSVSRTSNEVTVVLTHNLPVWMTNGMTITTDFQDTTFSATNVTITILSANSFKYTKNGSNGAASALTGAIFGEPTSNLLSGNTFTPSTIRERWIARRVYECAMLIKAANGGVIGTRVKMVFMGQLANFVAGGGQMQGNQLPWLESQYGPVSAWLTAIGGAPYPRGSGTTSTDILTSMDSENDLLDDQYHSLKYTAQKYGVQAWLYEGGPDLIGVNATRTEQVYADPNYRTVAAKVYRRAFEWDMDKLISLSIGISWDNTEGASTWGMGYDMPSILPVGSPSSYKMAGFDDVLLAAPPAIGTRETRTLPGTITYCTTGGNNKSDEYFSCFILNGMLCPTIAAGYTEMLIYTSAANAGNHQLTIYGKFYNQFNTNNNNLRVLVDGVSQGTIALFSDGADVFTGPAGGTASPGTITVPLSEGWHILRLQAPAGGQPDRIGVSKIVGVKV